MDEAYHNPNPPSKDYDGPCRQTVTSMLQNKISFMEKELVGLRALLKISEKAEAGSPLEEAMWGMLHRSL